METSRLDTLRSALLAEGVSSVTLKDGTLVLVDPGRMQVARLNETAAAVVDLIRGGAASEDELVAGILPLFEVEPEVARREIRELLTTLESGLLGRSGS